ncbi:MAG TPA: hypothetical protein VK190_06415 [Pseudoneobacillus sp.]|nr:hypothetical protein [Pseudoneobacillus sp.]
MVLLSNLGFYEMDFNNNIFKHLQYIRIDKICEEIYVTMKNVITGEILTFEHSGINWIRKMDFSFELLPLSIEGIAQKHVLSLY